MDSNELEKINSLLDRDVELREVILPPFRRIRPCAHPRYRK